MLWIHHLGLPRVNAKKSGVEQIDILQHGPGAHEPLALGFISLAAGGKLQFVLTKTGNCLYAANQVLPQLIDIAGARKSAGHSDYRYAGRFVLFV
jgi:hypothetical protein